MGKKALSHLEVKQIKDIGRHAVGSGLYLQVSKWNTRAWIYRYQISGRRREMGLGACDQVSLAQARKEVEKWQALVRRGIDPKIARDTEYEKNVQSQIWTFDKCAEEYITSHSPSWKNKKHGQQWANTLKTYASPVIGQLPVQEIDTERVMRVIEPIWLVKTETASRIRARIERILSWAIVNGYREHPNPAVWRGNISELLPKQSSVSKEKHHAAMPYSEAPVFMRELSEYSSVTAKAMAFTILTACRTSEVIKASWDEIDMDKLLWTIPSNRTKSKREHRVPLNHQSISLLRSLPKCEGWLFPSVHSGKHISNIAMLKMLKGRLGRPDLTVHGFRSTFRDWCAETTNYHREIAEAALAHTLKDKTEAAYQRGDLLEKRRALMNDWSVFLVGKNENVIKLKYE